MNTSKSLNDAIKRSYLTLTTIAKDDPLQDAFDTWVDVNGQRFGVTFDRAAIVEAVEGIYGDSDGLREFAGLNLIKSVPEVPSKRKETRC